MRWALLVCGLGAAMLDLLDEMSLAVDLPFNKVALRHDTYWPTAHGDPELDQLLLRGFLLEVMSGKRVLPVGVVTDPKSPIEMEIVQTPPRQDD